MLADRLTPVREAPASKTLIADLDSRNFRARELAARRLHDLGDAARPALTAAVAAGPNPESRQRLEALLAALAPRRPPAPLDLQRLRALVVLERIGTTAAKARVEDLAAGLEGA